MPKKNRPTQGSHNKGYFFRTGRGWFTKEAGQFIPLTDEAGIRLIHRNAAGVREAYARHLLAWANLSRRRSQVGVVWPISCPADSLRCR